MRRALALLIFLLPAAALAVPEFDPFPVPANPGPGFSLPLAASSGPDAEDLPSTIDVKMENGTIVTMDLEEYLKGVLPKEVGSTFPIEAIKAQAVAARSYAVWYAWSKGSICTTTTCQVWSETHYDVTDAAVEATRGQVMAWNGKVVPFFFSASCGGHTVSNADVWSGDPLPWLTPSPCIENKIGACEVTCTPDHPKDATCWGIYGHRVGLCQRGAQAMAACGSTYADIVLHYAGGATLTGPDGPVPLGHPDGTPDAAAEEAVVAEAADVPGDSATTETTADDTATTEVATPDTAATDVGGTEPDTGAVVDPGTAADPGSMPLPVRSSGSGCAAARSAGAGLFPLLILSLSLFLFLSLNLSLNLSWNRSARRAPGR